jgi:enoyl-CoA hydratase/carnithine racemase
MRQELLEAIEQVATTDARVLVIKAAGENFSLGGDARDWPGVSVAELSLFIALLRDVRC